MHFNALHVSTLLTAAAACALPAKKDPYWTVKDIKRNCGDNGCSYTFDVETHDGSDDSSCKADINKKEMKDATRMSLQCGALFGDVTAGPQSTSFHVYSHASDHINHIMFTVDNKEFDSDKAIPPSDHDIFTTSTI